MTRFSLLLTPAMVLLLAISVQAAEIRGRIAKVDLKTKEVRVEGTLLYRGQNLTLIYTPDTRILFRNDPGEAKDLATGVRARVFYELGPDNKPVAQVIRVSGSKPDRPAPDTSSPATPAPSRPAASAPAERRGDKQISGMLRRVALTDRELVVIGPGEQGPKTETTIKVPEDAPVFRDGQPIPYEQLREEEKVTVDVRRQGKGWVALTVHAGKVVLARGGAPARKPREDTLSKIRRGLQIADAILGIVQEIKRCKEGK
jgi:hypothetical protein